MDFEQGIIREAENERKAVWSSVEVVMQVGLPDVDETGLGIRL